MTLLLWEKINISFHPIVRKKSMLFCFVRMYLYEDYFVLSSWIIWRRQVLGGICFGSLLFYSNCSALSWTETIWFLNGYGPWQCECDWLHAVTDSANLTYIYCIANISISFKSLRTLLYLYQLGMTETLRILNRKGVDNLWTQKL